MDALDEATREVSEAAARMAARWLTADLAARRALDDMAETTERIVDLIAAVKGDSNQDRAPAKEPIDLDAGIRSTLTMLAHKLRHKGLAQDVGEGSGIGLDIVHRIVHARGGEIRVASEPGRTCLEVRLPASPPVGEGT